MLKRTLRNTNIYSESVGNGGMAEWRNGGMVGWRKAVEQWECGGAGQVAAAAECESVVAIPLASF
jgi:hypothetical protein